MVRAWTVGSCSGGHQRSVSEVLGCCPAGSAAGHSTGARALVYPQPRNRDWGNRAVEPQHLRASRTGTGGDEPGTKELYPIRMAPKAVHLPKGHIQSQAPAALGPGPLLSNSAGFMGIFCRLADVCGAENKHGTVKAELLKPLNPRTHLPVKLCWPL